MIYNGFRIVNSDDALEAFLELERSLPRLIDVLVREVFEDGDPLPNEGPVFVFSLKEGDRRVDFPVLVEEGRG